MNFDMLPRWWLPILAGVRQQRDAGRADTASFRLAVAAQTPTAPQHRRMNIRRIVSQPRSKGDAVKYMLLICVDESIIFSQEHHAVTAAATDAWVADTTGRGIRLLPGDVTALGRRRHQRTGPRRRVLLTDGPFAETKEQIAGFDLIECANLDEALDVAARHPGAGFGTVEVRPVLQW